jgi:maltose O-acetyltransferase
MWRHLVNIFLYFLPPTRLFVLRRMLLRSANIEIHDGAHLCGKSWIFGPGNLVIGSKSWISPGCTFYTHSSAPITVGKDCDIGHEVSFVTGSHQLGNEERRAGTGSAHPIIVGDGTWIGARSTILGSVRIGKGCMIAAGSVVISDIADNVLAAGVPAKVKRNLSH